MKKFYRKSTVHPTPMVVSEHLLSFLPAAILTLTAALSPADKEVLAYLISCSSINFSSSQRKAAQKMAADCGDHAACFSCNCFRCYMSYWAKWDSSPNRQLIHEIIDAFEETLLKESKKEKNKKERRKGKSVKAGVLTEPKYSEVSLTNEDFILGESSTATESGIDGDGRREEENNGEDEEEEEELEKGSMRRHFIFVTKSYLLLACGTPHLQCKLNLVF